jgi:hypothetical protein
MDDPRFVAVAEMIFPKEDWHWTWSDGVLHIRLDFEGEAVDVLVPGTRFGSFMELLDPMRRIDKGACKEAGLALFSDLEWDWQRQGRPRSFRALGE